MSNAIIDGVENILQNLLRHLSDKRQVIEVSKKFSALRTNEERVSFVYGLLDEHGLFPELVRDLKSNELAGNFRQRGNDMFRVKKAAKAIELYTKSVALSEIGTEYSALAYANRSAVLFEKGLYEECLQDIRRALESNYPENLTSKLLTRREKANKLKPNQPPGHYFTTIPKSVETDPLIQCAFGPNTVEIKNTEDLGRHVVAARDCIPGDILAIEKPFAHILIEQHYNHCHHCLALCYNLIPCLNCTDALYCSETCRISAEAYHKYECPILATTKALQMDKLKLLPMKISIIVKGQYRDLKDNITGDEVYRSDRYKEIHELVANTESRSVSDLFSRATTAAIIYHLVKSYTSFFDAADEEAIFKELLLLHLQTSACNFHEISELAEIAVDIYEHGEIGAGAYAFLSMFNHSCFPNVVRHCYGPVIVLRATQVIKKGEQCYDNYGYHHAVMTRSERRAKLKKQYFFDCNCKACEEDWPFYGNLPALDCGCLINTEVFNKLQNADAKTAMTIIDDVVPKIVQIQALVPCKDFDELQEVLKQCFAWLGNVRRTL